MYVLWSTRVRWAAGKLASFITTKVAANMWARDTKLDYHD